MDTEPATLVDSDDQPLPLNDDDGSDSDSSQQRGNERKTSSSHELRQHDVAQSPQPDTDRRSHSDHRVVKRNSQDAVSFLAGSVHSKPGSLYISGNTVATASTKSLTQISMAVEKRHRLQNPPKSFTLDKAKAVSIESQHSRRSSFTSYTAALAAAAASSANNSANNTRQSYATDRSSRHSSTAVSVHTAPRSVHEAHDSSQEVAGTSTAPPTTGMDREVSTSFSESLDQLFEKSAFVARVNYEKRLSALQEERSRPSSAVIPGDVDVMSQQQQQLLLQQQSPMPGDPTFSQTFDDMNFVQYGSEDIVYETKKKQAKIIGRYVMGDVLGEGSYGKVKEGYCIETLKRVAIKIMRQSKLRKIPMGEQNVKREIKILKRLRHKNVADMMDVIYNQEKHKMYVVFEYCAGTLSDLMARAPEQKLPPHQCQRYLKQLVHGMCYLHAHSVIHRDIKPGNLLVTFDDVIKISDFGVAEELNRYTADDTITTSSGSPAFQPPEVALGKDSFSGTKVDVWAVGVTLYNMISGKLPFDGDSIYALFENIGKGDFSMPAEADAILCDLLSGVMDCDADTRMSMEELAVHPWLRVQMERLRQREISVLDTASRISRSPTTDSAMLGSPPPSTRDFRQLQQQQQQLLVTSSTDISNQNYAYDTTLIPYLESMFVDLPTSVRRSSVVAMMQRDLRVSRGGLTEKFFRRMTKSNIGLPEEDTQSPQSPDSKSNTLSPTRTHTRQQSMRSNSGFSVRSTISRQDSDRCKMQ